MRGASHTLWQNLLVLQVQSDVKIVYPRRPASPEHISACCASSGNTHAQTELPLCYILYDTDSRKKLRRMHIDCCTEVCLTDQAYVGGVAESSSQFFLCAFNLKVSLLSLNNVMALFMTNDGI